MLIARVIGTVVATRKDEELVGYKLLVVRPLPLDGSGPDGRLPEPFVAVDTVGAGVGERVLVVTGSSARAISDRVRLPVDAAIVGIIDTVELEEGAVPGSEDPAP
ncbi:MAG: EutN/CcmL family microcompartment protein [Desulfotomaculales bacterium]